MGRKHEREESNDNKQGINSSIWFWYKVKDSSGTSLYKNYFTVGLSYPLVEIFHVQSNLYLNQNHIEILIFRK